MLTNKTTTENEKIDHEKRIMREILDCDGKSVNIEETNEEEIRREIKLILGSHDDVSEQAEQFRNGLKKLREKSVYTPERTISYDFLYEMDNEDSSSDEKNDYLNLLDLTQSTRVEILRVDNLDIKSQGSENTYLFICCELFHGSLPITRPRFTRMIAHQEIPLQWNEFVVFNDILLSNLPRETRICFTIFSRIVNESDKTLDAPQSVNGKDIPLGCVVTPIMDFKGLLKQGEYRSEMRMNEKASPMSIPIETSESESTLTLAYRFESHSNQVKFSNGSLSTIANESFDSFEMNVKEFLQNFTQEEQWNRIINDILPKDFPLTLTQEERWLLWWNRENLLEIPTALSKFILSVPWKFPKAVQIAHSILPRWKPINPIDALELLSYNFSDSKVRRYAIERLNELDDSQLSDFTLPLVQSLKYELYHDSSLSRFLLERSLRSTYIGHYFFWYLKSEMHLPTIKERNRIILEEYLFNCGDNLRREYLKQTYMLNQLLDISIEIKKEKTDQDSVMRTLLSNIEQPKRYRLPLSPYMEVTGIIMEKCKVMDEKHRSLWLCFKNADKSGENINVIFKEGEDVRSDQLILQMLRKMDQLWKNEGLDIHMKPYSCICTGEKSGMIQVVNNSDTMANLMSSFAKSFRQNPLNQIFTTLNKQDDMDVIIDNFIHSCAGYCPATYVLGIGNRHNDNIMLTPNGDLFHINFNSILGKGQSFTSINIQSVPPFVFTPMYAEFIGGEKSENFEKKFCELSCRAFGVLCKNGRMIISFFTLMLGSGIPHLENIESLMWLKKCLILSESNLITSSSEQINQHFRQQIRMALNKVRPRVND